MCDALAAAAWHRVGVNMGHLLDPLKRVYAAASAARASTKAGKSSPDLLKID